MHIDPGELDRYITGNYGEDQHEEEPELCAALFEMHPRPWVADDNRDGHIGLMSVFDANGRSIVCTCDMEACEGGDIELAHAIAALPALIELARVVGMDYEDAADWKDARGTLVNQARSALARLSW
jgi:hypothetical protein